LPTLVRQITEAPSGVPVSRQTAIICNLSDELVAIKVMIEYMNDLQETPLKMAPPAPQP